MPGLLTMRFGGEKDARFRLRMRLGEADNEGVSDLIGVRSAAGSYLKFHPTIVVCANTSMRWRLSRENGQRDGS